MLIFTCVTMATLMFVFQCGHLGACCMSCCAWQDRMHIKLDEYRFLRRLLLLILNSKASMNTALWTIQTIDLQLRNFTRNFKRLPSVPNMSYMNLISPMELRLQVFHLRSAVLVMLDTSIWNTFWYQALIFNQLQQNFSFITQYFYKFK